jgi:hypothetical protein
MYELPKYVGRSASGKNINELTFNAYAQIRDYATAIPSRNGDCHSLYDFSYRLLDPRQRHLHLSGRKSNIFQLVGESLWILAGSDNVLGYLETFLPRAPQYSDDGQTWRAGYGPRLVRYNQLNDVVEFFRKDGKMTRRAVVSIHDPSRDTFTQLKVVYGQDDTKDLPCNLMLLFYVTPDDFFHCKVLNRSNDSVFGMGINLTEFSIIQEMIYEQVVQIHPELKLGMLTVNSNNFHCYEFTRPQLDAVLSNPYSDPVTMVDSVSLGVTDLRLCQQSMANFIEQVVDIKDPYDILDDTMLGYTPTGQLAHYVEIMRHYFAARNGSDVTLNVDSYQSDLIYAVVKSPFRKFNIEV